MYDSGGMERVGAMDIEEHIERRGYGSMVCHRSHLVELLLFKIPKDKLHYGKRVVSIAQDAHGGAIH
ncbi:hypothetical protein BGZ59_006568 [Podila verticillata]|nr:hypothetical protein BGZ59_006568 [Podila verticillata]KAI9239216.1 MAG: hypothetical protein BYD32DRAFT_459990 [Podila humilis]KFH66959.1 hypothetical protein MVEG_07483 [Podila verticillata NRRL 6337]